MVMIDNLYILMFNRSNISFKNFPLKMWRTKNKIQIYINTHPFSEQNTFLRIPRD